MVTSEISPNSSEKLNLSRKQFLIRRTKTLSALRPIHISSSGKKGEVSSEDNKLVLDGLWSTLICTAPKPVMANYIKNSNQCMHELIPNIVKGKIKEYEKSKENRVRSMRVLYEGGLIRKRKYTSIRNSSDVVKETEKKRKNVKTEFMTGCEVPKILPYKTLMTFVRGIEVGELLPLENLAATFNIEAFPGVYRPLQPFLLRLADMYLFLDSKNPCLHWFNGQKGVMYVAIGADGAPFGKDDTATAYLVSILNLLSRVQSCNDNHLLMGANCAEDTKLMKKYTEHLRKEMEEMEGKKLTTAKGHQVEFRFELIPADMKWASCMSGELNNCAVYFSPFANVNQTDKTTIGGSIGGDKATWHPWNYQKRLETAKKVEQWKARLKDPDGKQRGEVTKLIAKEKSRQEFVPPLGKYVDCIKAEPLHNTNNAWQQWFLALLTVVMQYTSQAQLKASTVVSDLPIASPLVLFLKCVRETVKCGRLYNGFLRWFSEKRKKGVQFSYRFTGLESKRFSWNFASLIQEVLKIANLSQGSVLKLHTLAFAGLNLRDSAAIYSRVEVNKQQTENLKTMCQHDFTANCLLLSGVNPTVWTVGYAIPYHTNQLFEKMGFGLGLNSMQGREAKHIKLAKYVENTCNVRKSMRWWIVFRHEFVSILWLREMDPFSVSYRQEKRNACESYIPKRVKDGDDRFCYCGLLKASPSDGGCTICTSDVMHLVKKSVVTGKVDSELKTKLNNQ